MRKLAAFVITLMLPIALGACGLKPMYAGGASGGVAQGLASVDVSAIEGGGLGHAALSRTVAEDGDKWMRPLSFFTDQGRRTPPSCSATARPDCRPSS